MKFKSNILFLTNHYPEPINGSNQRAYWTIDALCSIGYSVHSISVLQPNDEMHSLNRLVSKHYGFSYSKYLLSDSTYDVVWVSCFWNYTGLDYAIQFLEKILKSNPDIKIVVDLSDVLIDDAKDKHPGNQLIHEKIFDFECKILSMADCAVWVSEAERQNAIDIYKIKPSKTYVIPTYSPRNSFDLMGFDDRLPFVCMAGSDHPHNFNAIKFAIDEVMPIVKKTHKDCELHVFGNGTMKFESKLEPLEYLKIKGFVENFQNQLGSYRVHLAPTISGGGVKTKIMESLSVGTPIVGNYKSIYGTEIHSCSAVFAATSASEMAERICSLISDRDLWSEAHNQALNLFDKNSDYNYFLKSVENVSRVACIKNSNNNKKIVYRKGKSLPFKLIIGTHHKTGTVLMQGIFRSISTNFGFRYFDCSNKLVSSDNWDILYDNDSSFDGLFFNEKIRGIHLIRDPRMIIISSAYYHMKSSEGWLHIPQDNFLGMTYQEKINSFNTDQERFIFEMENEGGRTVKKMHEFCLKKLNSCLDVKLEDLMTDFNFSKYSEIFEYFGFFGDDLKQAINIANEHSVFNDTKKIPLHVRSPQVEDWRVYYDVNLLNYFSDKFGEVCQDLGYN